MWLELLHQRYMQHASDSARLEREPLPFDRWAVERTWTEFVTLARVVINLPPYDVKDWETNEPIPGSAGAYGSRNLARHLISALVLVNAILDGMDRRMRAAVRRYLLHNRMSPRLPDAKRFVYDWLVKTARYEEAVTR